MDVSCYLKAAPCLLAATGSGAMAVLGWVHHAVPGVEHAPVAVVSYNIAAMKNQGERGDHIA